MRRRIPSLAIVIAVVTAMTGAAIVIATDRASKSTLTNTGRVVSVTSFIKSMKGATNTRFAVTYHVTGYLFFGIGTFVIAQIPSPPGTKMKTNLDGYSGTGHYAYIFRGPTGRIIQWIKIDTNVSACANVPITGNYATGTFGKLRCSRPGPYIPSNGFAEADAGFVPNYVLQQVAGFVQGHTQKKATITARESKEFGPLRCLAQFSGPSTQTTCIDQKGYIVSWLVQNGSGYFSRSMLASINHHPTAHDFATIVQPTTSFLLPAV